MQEGQAPKKNKDFLLLYSELQSRCGSRALLDLGKSTNSISKTSSLHGFTIYFFSLLETSCEQDDNFPSSVCVKVNGRLQTLPNPIPTNKPGVEPKRPPKPIDITALCKLSSTVPNFVNVTWAVEVRIYILKVRNSTNYGCFANYQSQNITKYFPFISLSRTC